MGAHRRSVYAPVLASVPALVRVEDRHGCAWVTLDRPPLNLIVPELIAELRAAFDGLARDPQVRVVELREMGVVIETGGGARLPVSAGAHVWSVGDRALLCLRPEALRVEMITSALVGRSFKLGDHVRVEVSPETSILLPDEGGAA